jgi:hypothetical protein
MAQWLLDCTVKPGNDSGGDARERPQQIPAWIPGSPLTRRPGMTNHHTGVRNFLYKSCTAASASLLSGMSIGSPRSAERSAAM